ncbi:spore coat protein GerQ [Oceanobacillus damuensis]|uniref:spore coat protein GerQ n=1 Tax=Oceanobacillus damuensis TaxID=937928 RepID=UPI000829D789|nr:spore coat protein GerQ [Oceanobacillus damuensis]
MSENQNNVNPQYPPHSQAGPYYYYPSSSPAYYPMYNTRQFQPAPPQSQQIQQQAPDIPGMLPLQQSYIENILRLNRGKLVTVYMTFENNTQWNAMTFTGIIEAAGRDHIILSQPETGRRVLLLMIYLDYVTFDEEINYEYPLANGSQQMATFPPR